MTIYFYSSREDPYGCFSNFSKHDFELDGNHWKTNEHYFQAQKFIYSDPEWFKKIMLKTNNPWDAAKMGRNKSHVLRYDWESVKDGIMRKGLIQKFSTHPDIKEVLLSTGDEHIVENSPIDYYWGCGEDKSGKNMLGKLLVSIRNEFRKID